MLVADILLPLASRRFGWRYSPVKRAGSSSRRCSNISAGPSRARNSAATGRPTGRWGVSGSEGPLWRGSMSPQWFGAGGLAAPNMSVGQRTELDPLQTFRCLVRNGAILYSGWLGRVAGNGERRPDRHYRQGASSRCAAALGSERRRGALGWPTRTVAVRVGSGILPQRPPPFSSVLPGCRPIGSTARNVAASFGTPAPTRGAVASEAVQPEAPAT